MSDLRPAMRRLYCDNAATTFPKPAEVMRAVAAYAGEVGASAGRGQYAEARESARVILQCRERLNTLFHGENPLHFIFTLNCTDALNLAIQGIFHGGDDAAARGGKRAGHAITTWLDHNSVQRTLHALGESDGVETTRVALSGADGIVDPADVKKAIRPDTRLIAVVHGSNVTGAIQPIREIGKIARDAGIPFLVDAAQTAGHVPIDVQADFIDVLAFPGHKGLLGCQGTGALYIRPGLEQKVRPLRFGGTGSASDHAYQPDWMPDRFESGSHNAMGIAGLSEGVAWILKKTVAAMWQHDQALCKTFMESVDGCEGLRYLGPQGIRNRMGVFSLVVDGVGPVDLARRLEEEFGILSRAGIHCAPFAHEYLGTVARGGTTRISFGPFLELPDVQYIGDALASIALGAAAAAT